MELNAAYLQQKLNQLSRLPRYYVAFSGGVDSCVLLYLLNQLRQQQPELDIKAIHVNHGLQTQAGDWARYCQNVCDELEIPLLIKSVKVVLDNGQSPEAAAREARYAVFREMLGEGEGLFMAHHQDDQAETVLLQLFRGAGAAGLAAMPESIAFEKGWLLRPFLGVAREQIEDYANQHGLKWIEDPSNIDTGFDRNFLRHDIIPKLTCRWPSLNTTLSRVASHQAEAARLLDVLAEQDYQLAQGQTPQTLSVSAVLMLDAGRQRNLLRYWLKTICQLSTPDSRHLQRILSEVLLAAVDASPLVEWGEVEVRRYRDELYALSASSAKDVAESFLQQPWNLDKPFILPDGSTLQIKQTQGKGLKQSLAKRSDVSVGFRQGGEDCRPVGRGHRHSLKKLMQEWGIPPWQRDHIPLLFVGDEPAQVVGYCLCEPFQAEPDEIGLFISQTGV